MPTFDPQSFSSSGSYTVPSGSWYMVSCKMAGGGGGGGAGFPPALAEGAGGGGGGEAEEVVFNVCSHLLTGGYTIDVTVGTGGAGAPDTTVNGDNGNASVLSIFDGPFGPMLPAPTLIASFATGYGSGGTSATDEFTPGSGGIGADGGAGGSNGGYDGTPGAGGNNGTPGAPGGDGGSASQNMGLPGSNGYVQFVLMSADVFGTDISGFVAVANTTCTINQSSIFGDVGSITGTTLTSSTVNGTVYPDADAAVSNALVAAEGARAGLIDPNFVTPTTEYTGSALGGVIPTLSAGVYYWSGAANVDSTFSLDGPGIYVFQSAGTWKINANANIVCTNGARPEDVYFVSGGNITVNPTVFPKQIFGNYIAGGDLSAIGPTQYIFGTLFSPAGYVNINQLNNLRLPSAWCYAKGTKVLTARGYIAIEDISTDDMIVTRGLIDSDGNVPDSVESVQPVVYVGKFTMNRLNKMSYPVCFKKDSLGKDMPFEDLIVSPNHALFIDGRRTAADWFINNDTIYQMSHLQKMDYYVIELPAHSVIVVNGALSESMLGDRNAFVTVTKNESLIESMIPAA